MMAETIDAKVIIIQREYYAMAKIPKPKEKSAQDNLKMEDFMNKGNIEEMLVSLLKSVFIYSFF